MATKSANSTAKWQHSRTLQFTVIDAMASRAFTGNPTPVIVLDDLKGWLSVETMQMIAKEMQQSETCFVRRKTPSDPQNYRIRWFTPVHEEPFCGHAVLAAAVSLYQQTGQRVFTFESFSGIIAHAYVPESEIDDPETPGTSTAVLEFPAHPINDNPSAYESYRANLAEVLGIRADQILHMGMNALLDISIEVDPLVDFSAATMDIDPVRLMLVSPPKSRSQIITSSWQQTAEVDFAKRVFAYGKEDQATGSTHCSLAPYWSRKLGKQKLRAIQVSERTGVVELDMKEDNGVVGIRAQGIKTMEGTITLPFSAFQLDLPLAKL